MSDLNLGNLSKEQLVALVENLRASAPAPRSLTCKVSEKGALCVYGLGRFPVTLYASQWNRLLDHADAIRAFAKRPENAARLTRKPE